jgi:transposase InsO family protein
MYVWWPGINADMEKSVRLCRACQEVHVVSTTSPLNPWKWPTKPLTRLHLDFAGPFQGKLILVDIDAHSEATCTSSTSSLCVNCTLPLFAKFGLPQTIVTDNGTGFTSEQFKSFLKENGAKHITLAPYHPASNGLAERAVQIVKKRLKKVTTGSMNTRLAKLSRYTPIDNWNFTRRTSFTSTTSYSSRSSTSEYSAQGGGKAASSGTKTPFESSSSLISEWVP